MNGPAFRPQPSAPMAALILGLAVLATQLVGLGREVIDPDESTFILMGADVARGNLPFVNMFDLKPPMIFLMIGGVLATFGKSLIAVRLLGDFLLFGTAMLTFRFARHLAGGWSALGGGLIYVAFASMDLGQPTYSELPALFFAMGALLALAATPVSLARAALAGLLLALAVLSRTNLYQLPVVFGLILLIAALRRNALVHPRAWLAFGLGGLLPVGLLILAYARADQLDLLKLAMIDVPLAYSQQSGPLAALRENVTQFYVTTTMEPLIIIPMVLLTLAGLARLIAICRAQPGSPRWAGGIAILALGTLLVSLVLSGAVYPHYWLQLAPVLGVLCALGLDGIGRIGRGVLAATGVLIPLGAAAADRVPEGLEVIANPQASAQSFDIAKSAQFIRSAGGAKATVWPWRMQLIGWYLDAPQLSKAGVQPENIARPPIVGPLAEHGYVSPDEVGRLMALVPDFVVTDAKGNGLGWMRATGRPVDQWLATHYRLERQFGDVLVYRKIS